MSTVLAESTVTAIAAKKPRNTNKQVRIAIIALAAEQGIEVIFKGFTTRVILPSGTSGKAKCDPADVYSPLQGYQIARSRAIVRTAEKAITRVRHGKLV
jgi:hypothetical protein